MERGEGEPSTEILSLLRTGGHWRRDGPASQGQLWYDNNPVTHPFLTAHSAPTSAISHLHIPYPLQIHTLHTTIHYQQPAILGSWSLTSHSSFLGAPGTTDINVKAPQCLPFAQPR